MLQSHSADLELRSRKCGKQPSNNKPDDVDNTSSWSDEAQTTRRPSTEHTQSMDNTQVAEMSTTSKSTPHRSSLGKSSIEDLDVRENENEMWRNELQQNDELLPEAEPDQDPPVPARRKKYSDLVDIVIRIVITLIFFKLETMSAFRRQIHSEELWLYKNPPRPDIVRGGDLLFFVIAVPLLLTIIFYAFTKDRRDFRAASWAWTLAVCSNAVPTSLLKISVGRPRPDFFYRCFPDGVMVLNETADAIGSSLLDFNCTGIPSVINEGRKSFPSGHSSFAFASFGFVTYYVVAKLQAFDARGRGHTWRLFIAIMPLIVAALVAVSRTCDYHHHWQDVVVGALIGLATGYISYRQYYPSIFSTDAGRPFENAGDEMCRPLLGKQTSKWR
ncbi:phospholipid phosphatase 5 isoform X1 [Drosophila virilis]|uniref:Phosphatidic acid phosphatase type 2/haloperoxidase domain-containing protein n=1 Tax=Drosophila virilis TaxID=7244 RepID=B4LZA8_DROVI|nr:phospholipid phosphatase 5 isoform X1 [Drosophila virilis]EDW68143.2 uncharacterized protein Dvir_GJ24555 [Drosophila virilis]